jgi:hypothetical protein
MKRLLRRNSPIISPLHFVRRPRAAEALAEAQALA